MTADGREEASAQEAGLAGMDLDAHLADPTIRQRFVTRMFDVIAPRYDRFTRVFSFGMDAGWKRELLTSASRSIGAGSVVLDLACGTGDLALAIAQSVPGARVAGIDASPRMIEAAGARRREAGTVEAEFLVGDMMRLPVPDDSVDVVLAGYGIRNVPDADCALDEMARVLRSGGRVHVLDFFLPEFRPWRWLFLMYLRLAGNAIGWLWHREPVVYGYIAASIERWVTPAEFRRMLARAGFEVIAERRHLLDGVVVCEGRRS